MATSRSSSPSEIDDEHDLHAILSSSEPVIDLNLSNKLLTSNRQFHCSFHCRDHSTPGHARQELKRLVERAQDVEKEMEQCKFKEIDLIARCVMQYLVSLLTDC